MSERIWYITHATYSRVIDILASRGYANEDEAAAAVRKEFGLKPGYTYKIVIETEQDRVRRSLGDFFGRNPLEVEG